MNIEIMEYPVRFQLYGLTDILQDDRCDLLGLRLMNELWQHIKGAKVATAGINHWVYLANRKMFVGVELQKVHSPSIPDRLELRTFELTRSMKHVHIGPYQLLPQKWAALKAELADRGEVIGVPSLEIYGHHCEDPEKLETTILIALRARSV